MAGTKYIKLLGLIISVAAVDVIVLSPGLLGSQMIGGSALTTAIGVTLLFASTLMLLYGSYTLLFKPPVVIPIKQIQTHEDYVEALAPYRRIGALNHDITLAIEQLDRMRRKKLTLFHVLRQRFELTELSYKKFASVTSEVEKLFYLNVRSMLNRLHVFDEAEFERAMKGRASAFSRKLLEEKTIVYNDFLLFLQSSISANEEILLKLDKLMLEISRLDSFELGEIENMPCMQEIDSLIKQTKYYKQ